MSIAQRNLRASAANDVRKRDIRLKSEDVSHRLSAMFKIAGLLLVGMFSANTCWGEQGIAVLDFELNDLTLLPNSLEEQERTRSIRPLLEGALEKFDHIEIVPIAASDIAAANAGFGYLFEHADAVAALGKRHNAQWVVVGRLHKPTHLFAYLMVHLIKVETAELVDNIIIEVKGQQQLVTRKGVERLADKIRATLLH